MRIRILFNFALILTKPKKKGMPHISFASITQRNSNTKLTALAESSLKAAKEAHRVQKVEAELGVGLKISRMENVNSMCSAHVCVCHMWLEWSCLEISSFCELSAESANEKTVVRRTGTERHYNKKEKK